MSLTGDFPVHFGPESNVVWKTGMPPGHSSPCIWEDRIFLTGFADGKLETLCIKRADGNILWRKAAPDSAIEPCSGLGSPAASTPATDGQRLYVYFGSFGLLCYDYAGQELWRKPLPAPIVQHGTGTSPIPAGDLLILVNDQDVDSSVLAIRRDTGQTAWQTARPGFRRGYATPLLWREAGGEWIVVSGTLRVAGYNPKDGSESWSVSGLPNEMCASPVAGAGLLFVAGWTSGAGPARLGDFQNLLQQGDKNQDGMISRDEAAPGPARQHFTYIDANKDGQITREEWESMARIFNQSENALLAIRPGGQGDSTASHVAWKQTRGLPYVPSPLFYKDRVYIVKNGGMVSCFNATNGAVAYREERLDALGDYYASPVAARGKICVVSQPGMAVVLEAGDQLSILARNKLGEPIMATPAIVDRRLYLRTKSQLMAFGAP